MIKEFQEYLGFFFSLNHAALVGEALLRKAECLALVPLEDQRIILAGVIVADFVTWATGRF